MPGEPRGLLVRMGAQLDTSRPQPFLVPPFQWPCSPFCYMDAGVLVKQCRERQKLECF